MIIYARHKFWTALIMDDFVKLVRIKAVQIRADKVYSTEKKEIAIFDLSYLRNPLT